MPSPLCFLCYLMFNKSSIETNLIDKRRICAHSRLGGPRVESQSKIQNRKSKIPKPVPQTKKAVPGSLIRTRPPLRRDLQLSLYRISLHSFSLCCISIVQN